MPPPLQPRTPPGTLELLPREQMIFQHMVNVIRRGFERFGFVAIETPAFEFRDVLLTKSGGETEKQVYFVQSTGAMREGHEPELALRFDLTVPLARYVAEHERDLVFPFRRYQIQRVYRGERAQRGRFREFTQCDIDVIGKDKLDPVFEAEIPAIIVNIFEDLMVGSFTIAFSNRKVLQGLLLGHGVDEAERRQAVLREIDKLEKTGEKEVRASLARSGLASEIVDDLLRLVALKGSKTEILAALEQHKTAHPLFLEGLLDLKRMKEALEAMGVPDHRTRLDLSIARGLDYYTGTVYETFIDEHPEFGSVCSGGRYDDLAGLYTKSKLPGVGISIGLTRLFDQLRAHGLLKTSPTSVEIMIALLDPSLRTAYLALATQLRESGFNVDVYLEPAKLEKQLKYADKSGIPLVLLMGSNERAKGTILIKDLLAQTQTEVPVSDVIETLRSRIRVTA